MAGVPKLPPSEHADITWRIICGETLQAVADDYGITRERVRQIAALSNVHGNELRYARMAMRVRKYAEEIIYHRESWHHIYWNTYGFSRETFEEHLANDDYPEYDELWIRYEAASSNPTTALACPDGRVCARCRVWQPWENFYADRNEWTKKARACIDCAKFNVVSYYQARYVPEPTVESKLCHKCDQVKPASEFYRNTHNNSGLQSYCKGCMDPNR